MSLLLALTGGGTPANYAITANAGAYANAGADASVIYTPNANDYTITAEAGAYFIGGQAATVGYVGLQFVGGGGGLIPQKAYQYRYKAKEKLDSIAPEIAQAITDQAVAVVSDEVSQYQAQKALESIGIAYKQAYQEIFNHLVQEMRQANEDEQIAITIALMI